VPVDVGADRVYRSMTLADCGHVELIALAEVLEDQARHDLAKAAAYRHLAEALKRRRARTVAQLPAAEVAAAFTYHDEEEKEAA